MNTANVDGRGDVPDGEEGMVELCRMWVQVLLPDARPAGKEGGSWNEEEVQNNDTCIYMVVISRRAERKCTFERIHRLWSTVKSSG